MDMLRKQFEAMEFSNVETFIASGNVIFDSAVKKVETLERRIEAVLHDSLGYEVATFVRSTAELAVISEYEPFPGAGREADNSGTLYIGFLGTAPTSHVKQKLISLSTEVDAFHVSGRELYWLCKAERFADSDFSGLKLEKLLGMPTTIRNVNTIRRIAKKYP